MWSVFCRGNQRKGKLLCFTRIRPFGAISFFCAKDLRIFLMKVHNLQQFGNIFRLRRKPRSYHVVRISHELDPSPPQIRMERAWIYHNCLTRFEVDQIE